MAGNIFTSIAWVCAVVTALGAPACSLDRDEPAASVTIDVRCRSSADCPARFSCTADSEHGPPTTLCESVDPEATCPAGFDSMSRYGQTFCKPRPEAASRIARERRRGGRP